MLRLTHVALIVQDLERSVEFYRDVVGLTLVHRREGASSRDSVAWFAHEDRPDPQFALVLIRPERPPGMGAQLTGWSHLGISLPDRAAVDSAAARGRQRGCLRMEPTYVDPVVGYICMLADPDGNGVEFSHGQVLGNA